MPMFPQMIPPNVAPVAPPLPVPMAPSGQMVQSGQMVTAPVPVPPPDTPWATAMQSSMPAMPVAQPAATVQQAPPDNVPNSEAAIKGLLTMFKNRQSELPSDMQQELKRVTTKGHKKDLHSASHQLAKARDEYDAAITARHQLLSNWRTFLCDAVKLWEGYASNFAEQEQTLQQRIASAKNSLADAKEEMDRAKVEAGEVEEVQSGDEIDEELTATTGSAVKITETMKGLASSLQSLKQEADALVDAAPSKRPRISSPRAEDVDMNGQKSASAALQPFGKAG